MFYLVKINLFGEELIGGVFVLIFNNIEDCFVCNKSEIIDNDFIYFENIEVFYLSVVENYKLGVELKKDFMFGFILD